MYKQPQATWKEYIIWTNFITFFFFKHHHKASRLATTNARSKKLIWSFSCSTLRGNFLIINFFEPFYLFYYTHGTIASPIWTCIMREWHFEHYQHHVGLLINVHFAPKAKRCMHDMDCGDKTCSKFLILSLYYLFVMRSL